MIIQLGNPNIPIRSEELSPGIRLVQTAVDFSKLPENPDWQEIEHLALLIDGYTLAETLADVRDLFDWFNPIWEAYLDANGPLPTDSLRLWLMLFACQRGYLRDRWQSENSDGSPSIYAIGIRNVYQALRLAIASEMGSPNPGHPVYLPARSCE